MAEGRPLLLSLLRQKHGIEDEEEDEDELRIKSSRSESSSSSFSSSSSIPLSAEPLIFPIEVVKAGIDNLGASSFFVKEIDFQGTMHFSRQSKRPQRRN
jgi:hypothetical protein